MLSKDVRSEEERKLNMEHEEKMIKWMQEWMVSEKGGRGQS